MEGLIKETIISPAYKKFIAGELDSITESDLCYVLQGTMNTDREILRSTYYTLKDIAEEMANGMMVVFLNKLKEKFPEYFK